MFESFNTLKRLALKEIGAVTESSEAAKLAIQRRLKNPAIVALAPPDQRRLLIAFSENHRLDEVKEISPTAEFVNFFPVVDRLGDPREVFTLSTGKPRRL